MLHWLILVTDLLNLYNEPDWENMNSLTEALDHLVHNTQLNSVWPKKVSYRLVALDRRYEEVVWQEFIRCPTRFLENPILLSLLHCMFPKRWHRVDPFMSISLTNHFRSITLQCLMGFWGNLVQLFCSCTWCAGQNFQFDGRCSWGPTCTSP